MKRINPSLAEPMRIGQHLLQIGLSLLVLGFSPQLAASETKAPADQTRAQQPHAGSLSHWDLSAVIDVGANSKSIELGARPKGSHLGHSDISVKGEIGEHLSLVGTVGAHSEGNDRSAIEHHVEALYLQTRSLPGGIGLKFGRFPSELGSLNAQHPHSDDFSERPLLYRGLLDRQWFDDGLRLEWTAPTSILLSIGLEAFRGDQLIPESEKTPTVGSVVYTFKLGDDLDRTNPWKIGLSFLDNRRQAEVEDHSAGHDHAHGARFSGQDNWFADLSWSWVGQGRQTGQRFDFGYEQALVKRIYPEIAGSPTHRASSISAVWHFSKRWNVGARADLLKVSMPHNDGNAISPEAAELREKSISLSFRPTGSTLFRLSHTQQHASGADDVFESPVKSSWGLQFVYEFDTHSHYGH